MAKYIASIELYNANKKDYERLNKEFQKEKFTGEQHAAKSEAYITSKKVFSIEGKITLLQINQVIAKIISRIGKPYSFFVLKDKHIVNS